MKEININIEGYNVNGICVGCLNYNRKMFYDDDVKECFKQIGNIDVPDGLTIQVCWECLAAVKNVIHFQSQILKSYEVLIDYSRQHTFLNSPEDFTCYATTRLSISPMTLAESTRFTCSLTSTDNCDIEIEVKKDVKEEQSDANEDFIEIETEPIKDEPEFQDTYSEEFQSQDLSSEEDIQLSKLKKKKKKDKKKKEKKKDENCNLHIDSANHNMASQNTVDPLSTTDNCVIRSDNLTVLLELTPESMPENPAAEKFLAETSAAEKSVPENTASEKSVVKNPLETNVRQVGPVTIATDSESELEDFPTISSVISTNTRATNTNTDVTNDIVISTQRNKQLRPGFQETQNINSKALTFQGDNTQSSNLNDNQLKYNISDISTTLKSVLESQRILGENQQVFSLELAKVRENQQNTSVELSKLNLNLEAFMKSFLTREIKLENSVHFEVIENMADLEQLENNLRDPTYKADLEKKFSVICGKQNGKGLNAAYKFVDLIFKRDFLQHCSWAGGSRTDEQKVCFKAYQRTIEFFFNLVKDTDNLFTLEDCESFFKTILRNSRKRSLMLNMRQSTRKMRKKRKLHVVQEKRSNDCVAQDFGTYEGSLDNNTLNSS